VVSIPSEDELLLVTLIFHLAPGPGMVKLHGCSQRRRVSIAGQPHAHDNLWHRSLVIYNESL